MRGTSGDGSGLRDGEIHVWIARLRDDDTATAEFIGVLDQEERARAARFVLEQHRTRFIQSHGIVRQILAGYADSDAAELTFARSQHGKPRLSQAPDGLDVHFSLSHSGDCCIVAVRLGHPVGIDVEQLRDLPQAVNIARRRFTLVESRLLASLTGADQRDAFFVLWTHKEAIVKALGASLATSLDHLEFELDSAGSANLVSWRGDQSIVRNWSIVRLDPAPGYVAAVASLHPFLALKQQAWNDIGPIVPPPVYR
jgi:4'-phosphopantetheinyl transferase